MTGRARAEHPQVWRVDVPMVMQDRRGNTMPWGLNDRVHWTKRRSNATRIRNDVAWLLKQAKVPHLDHVTVQLHYRPGDNRRRDADNLVATAKPAVDALVTAGVVRDDSPEFVTHLMPVIHPGRGVRALWLEITAGRTTPQQPRGATNPPHATVGPPTGAQRHTGGGS